MIQRHEGHRSARLWTLLILLPVDVALFLAGYATSERTPSHPSSGAVSYALVALSCVGFLTFVVLGIVFQSRSVKSRANR